MRRADINLGLQDRKDHRRVASNNYTEPVFVQLQRSIPGGGSFDIIDGQLLTVPASKTTTFRFDYTFTSDDAVAGKVTFKAIAVIDGAPDALPQDNEMIAPPTTVKAK